MSHYEGDEHPSMLQDPQTSEGHTHVQTADEQVVTMVRMPNGSKWKHIFFRDSSIQVLKAFFPFSCLLLIDDLWIGRDKYYLSSRYKSLFC